MCRGRAAESRVGGGGGWRPVERDSPRTQVMGGLVTHGFVHGGDDEGDAPAKQRRLRCAQLEGIQRRRRGGRENDGRRGDGRRTLVTGRDVLPPRGAQHHRRRAQQRRRRLRGVAVDEGRDGVADARRDVDRWRVGVVAVRCGAAARAELRERRRQRERRGDVDCAGAPALGASTAAGGGEAHRMALVLRPARRLVVEAVLGPIARVVRDGGAALARRPRAAGRVGGQPIVVELERDVGARDGVARGHAARARPPRARPAVGAALDVGVGAGGARSAARRYGEALVLVEAHAADDAPGSRVLVVADAAHGRRLGAGRWRRWRRWRRHTRRATRARRRGRRRGWRRRRKGRRGRRRGRRERRRGRRAGRRGSWWWSSGGTTPSDATTADG